MPYGLLGVVLLALMPPVTEVPAPVHVVIDEADVAALGGWPLDRKWYAVAVQNLTAGGARQVFLDLAFPMADRVHPESDELFFHELNRHPEVFVLAAPGTVGRDSLRVLGHYALPRWRAFAPFSAAFEPRGGRLLVRPGAAETLVGRMLPTLPPAPVLVDFPDGPVEADLSLLDVLQGRAAVDGRDVVVGLDYPGVTSYVAPARGGQLYATTALQVHAARQLAAGAYYRLWPLWMLGLVYVLPVVPLVVRRGDAGMRVAGSLALALGLLWGLPALRIYVAPGWYAVLAFPLGLAATGYVRHLRRANATLSARLAALPPVDDDAVRERDALRKRLRYYENLERFAPAAAVDDLDAGAAGLVLAPDSPLRDLLRKARQVARTDAPVLILGESGVGKEGVARYVHLQSARRDRPFLAVHCAAFNENLIESELFGHEAGAFTGATRRQRGRFERADGGTLFLDEVAETSPAVQVKLLRVLQEGVIERVGGTEPLRLSVRIVAATHRDLKAAMAEGRFREDLYYRLHGFALVVPPLRERPMDVVFLARHFIRAHDATLEGAPALLEWLARQPWPGNVRQLKAACERAVVNARMRGRTFLLPEDFELDGGGDLTGDEPAALQVLAGLRRHRFRHRSLSAVAREMGLHRATVTEYLRGWVIRYMRLYGGDVGAVCDALRGEAGVENEDAFRNRIARYMDGIGTRIAGGLRAGETDEEIRLGRFRNLQGAFEEDLRQLIGALRREAA